MTPVILLCGVAGAGKTTYARTLEADGYMRVSYDEEMWALACGSTEPTPDALAEADRRVRNRVRALIAAGRPVVLDASLSTRAIRDELRTFVSAAGGFPSLVVLDAPLELLVTRVLGRIDHADANAQYFEEDVLRRYYASFEFPGPDEPHTRIVTA